jgi:rod shape-determining protein MreD
VTGGRALAFVGLGYLALVLTASLGALSPWRVPMPEVALLIVIYLGLVDRGSLVGLAVVALVLGYFADLLGGAPRGLHALSLGLMLVGTRAASSRLLVSSVWQVMVVAFVAALAHGVLVVALAAPMYEGSAVAALAIAPWVALATSALSPFVFAFCRRVDRRLVPDTRGLRMVA